MSLLRDRETTLTHRLGRAEELMTKEFERLGDELVDTMTAAHDALPQH